MEPLEIRAARGKLTQASFARRLGVSVATVRNWETGRGRPTGSNRLALQAFMEAEGRASDAEGRVRMALRDAPDEFLLDEVRFRMSRGA